jgi:1-acyl-sn-glycerol-3-phosphate acyltransferase
MMDRAALSAVLYPYKAWMPAPIYWVYRVVRTVLVALCFGGFWSGSVLVGWLWLPFVVLWPGARVDKMRRVLRTVRRGFAVFHFSMRALRLYHRTSPFDVLRPAGARVGGPVVLVANHPTLCDVTSIVSKFPNVVAVARPSLANHPLLRRLVRACGFIPIGAHMLREAEERLRMGFDVLIFPEGTRSPLGGPLHPFHRGAFELAARANVPIVLLKLTCTPPALSKRLPIWRVADQMAVLTIEPIDTIYPATSELGSKATARAIEQRYRDLLGYPALPGAGGEPHLHGVVQ